MLGTCGCDEQHTLGESESDTVLKTKLKTSREVHPKDEGTVIVTTRTK